MATRTSAKSRDVKTEEKDRKNTDVVCCMDCVWANLIQYSNDPVLAECRKKPNVDNKNFPYQREVASARWICPTWKRDSQVKSVEKRENAA